MRKIFLTSNISKVLEKIIPLLSSRPENLKVAFIPTAAIGEGGDTSWTDEDKQNLEKRGFPVSVVNISQYQKEELKRELQQYDIIFVEGGNTFYLLQESQKSGFDKLIPELLDNGKIYIGSSAGSVLLGPTLDPIKNFDDPSFAPELKSFEGLNLINFIPFVHFGTLKYEDAYIKELHDFYSKGLPAILFNDTQFILVEDAKFTIYN